jgi:hypothetical protein
LTLWRLFLCDVNSVISVTLSEDAFEFGFKSGLFGEDFFNGARGKVFRRFLKIEVGCQQNMKEVGRQRNASTHARLLEGAQDVEARTSFEGVAEVT